MLTSPHGEVLAPPEDAEDIPVLRWGAAEYLPNAWSYYNIHARPEQFIYIATSRQTGKTTSMVAELDAAMSAPADAFGPPQVAVISWDFDHAGEIVRRWYGGGPGWAGAFATDGDIYSVNLHDHIIQNRQTGAVLRWYSSDNPYASQGKSFSHVLVDEAQRVQDLAISVMRPAMDVRGSRILACGTTDADPGCSWFYGGWLRGQDENETDYHSFTIDCWNNPWMSYDAIVRARNDPAMTEAQFRMLYLGQWVDIHGRFFTKWKHCFEQGGIWLNHREQGADYVMGLDLAKKHDYTVAYILDRVSGKVVDRWRIQRTPYDVIEDSAVDLYQKWDCSKAIVDATSGYEIMSDNLRRRGLIVSPVDFSSGDTKGELCVNLNTLLTRKALNIPHDPQLERELAEFLAKPLASGKFRYEAPDNFFDDCVMALALAATTMKHGAISPGRTLGYSYAGEDDEEDGWAW